MSPFLPAASEMMESDYDCAHPSCSRVGRKATNSVCPFYFQFSILLVITWECLLSYLKDSPKLLPLKTMVLFTLGNMVLKHTVEVLPLTSIEPVSVPHL